jgi:hypothetical protein
LKCDKGFSHAFVTTLLLRSDSIRNVAGLDNSFLFLCFTTYTSHRSALSPPDLEVWPLTKNQTASAPIDAEIECQASGHTPKKMYNSSLQAHHDKRHGNGQGACETVDGDGGGGAGRNTLAWARDIACGEDGVSSFFCCIVRRG